MTDFTSANQVVYRDGHIIAVALQAHGTYLNGSRLAKNKPTKLLGGEKISFGAHETHYSVSSSGVAFCS